MSNTLQVLRWAHIAAGFFGFVIAPVVLASRKGAATHRAWGRVYFWSMSFATLSAAALAAATSNVFFTFVGLFSFYLGFTGYRSLYLKDLGLGGRPSAVDWVVTSTALAIFVGMLGYGLWNMAARSAGFYLPLVVFGVFGLGLVGVDLRKYIRPPADRHAWFFGHMAGMVSSAIAALSAFSVVNLRMLPPPVRILWPAALGSPLLFLWMARYRRRFRRGVRVAEVAEVRIDQA